MARSVRKGITNKGEKGKFKDYIRSTKENESDNKVRQKGSTYPQNKTDKILHQKGIKANQDNVDY